MIPIWYKKDELILTFQAQFIFVNIAWIVFIAFKVFIILIVWKKRNVTINFTKFINNTAATNLNPHKIWFIRYVSCLFHFYLLQISIDISRLYITNSIVSVLALNLFHHPRHLINFISIDFAPHAKLDQYHSSHVVLKMYM